MLFHYRSTVLKQTLLPCCRQVYNKRMKLQDVIITTAVAYPGMGVADFFRECVRADIPGLPYREDGKGICGKISIRHVLKENCIPDFMVKHSHLLGDEIHHLVIPDDRIQEVLTLTIDNFILPVLAVATSETPIAKALAIMEKHDTTYLFIIDDGVYRGIVSIMGIAQSLMAEK